MRNFNEEAKEIQDEIILKYAKNFLKSKEEIINKIKSADRFLWLLPHDFFERSEWLQAIGDCGGLGWQERYRDKLKEACNHLSIKEATQCLQGEVYVIFGYASLGRSIADYIKRWPKDRVIFCDNSSKKQRVDNGHLVLSVREAVEGYPNSRFIIASLCHGKQMRTQLLELGVPSYRIVTELPDDIVNAQYETEKKQREDKRKELRFEVNISKHCNLNCKGCDHFAPLADQNNMDLGIYENDMRRMSELFHGMAWEIFLLGGEPLLNPNIILYMKIARECFPKTNIWIATNGILIEQMEEEFWRKCKEYTIGIMPTKYPIAIDYGRIGDIVRKNGLPYQFLGASESGRTLWKYPLDLNGGQDPKDSFLNCRNANYCLTLENGRLYTCSIAPNIVLFNEKFDQHIDLTDEDGIDIYTAKSSEEILETMAKPMPFCRYCDVKNRTYDHPWEVSKKDILEWT